MHSKKLLRNTLVAASFLFSVGCVSNQPPCPIVSITDFLNKCPLVDPQSRPKNLEPIRPLCMGFNPWKAQIIYRDSSIKLPDGNVLVIEDVTFYEVKSHIENPKTSERSKSRKTSYGSRVHTDHYVLVFNKSTNPYGGGVEAFAEISACP